MYFIDATSIVHKRLYGGSDRARLPTFNRAGWVIVRARLRGNKLENTNGPPSRLSGGMNAPIEKDILICPDCVFALALSVMAIGNSVVGS